MAKSKSNRTEIVQCACQVASALSEYGPYIKKASITTDSLYMAFRHPIYGQVRLSDHPGRLKFTWNIIVGGEDYSKGTLHFASDESIGPFLSYMKERFAILSHLSGK